MQIILQSYKNNSKFAKNFGDRFYYTDKRLKGNQVKILNSPAAVRLNPSGFKTLLTTLATEP